MGINEVRYGRERQILFSRENLLRKGPADSTYGGDQVIIWLLLGSKGVALAFLFGIVAFLLGLRKQTILC